MKVKPFHQNFTTRYLLALGLLAFLSLLAYFSFRQLIQAQDSSAAIINISGRQRMLSQRIAFFSLRMVQSHEAAEQENLRQTLTQTISLMEQAHEGLIHGDASLQLPAQLYSSVQQIYFNPPIKLDQQVKTYLNSAKALLKTPATALVETNPDLKYIITAASDELLVSLDQAVFQYQLESEAEIANLKTLETGVLLLTLMILVLEGCFIFYPMLRQVKQEIAQLTLSQGQLETHKTQLENNKQNLEKILNAIPLPLWIKNREGQHLFLNEAVLKAMRSDRETALGKTVYDFYPREVADAFVESENRAFTNQTTISQEFNYTLPSKNGKRPLTVLTTSSYLPDTQWGDVLINIAFDMSERKKVERMKDEFISTVSHELRTPLTAIRGSLGLVLGGVAGELPVQAQSMTKLAYTNSERLLRLINDILDIEKIEADKMVFELTSLELQAVIEQAIEVNSAYGAQFGVTFCLEQTIPQAKVKADNHRLIQVLTNLLSNAAKFSPLGEQVLISVVRHQQTLRVQISDNGPGISKEFQARIFQKFAQADASDTRQKGGTGLGLSIAKAIIEKHGGQIGFEVTGTKTIFYFDLPELIEPAAQPDNPVAPIPTFSALTD